MIKDRYFVIENVDGFKIIDTKVGLPVDSKSHAKLLCKALNDNE